MTGRDAVTTRTTSTSAHFVAVLDDDLGLASSICRVFAASGLRAEAFSDPSRLEAAVLQQAFDAFVLDWRLDETTALPLIRRLRERFNTAPIVLYTGQLAIGDRPTENEIALVLSDCRVEFRQKPYSHARLAQEIKSALD